MLHTKILYPQKTTSENDSILSNSSRDLDSSSNTYIYSIRIFILFIFLLCLLYFFVIKLLFLYVPVCYYCMLIKQSAVTKNLNDSQ